MLARAALAAGLVVVLATQAITPRALPVYDGVVVQDPYRFLAPAPGQDGLPTSAASNIPVMGGLIPGFAVYTTETPPQAEMLARGGEFSVSGGTTSLTVTIEPIEPPGGSSSVQIAGNVYRFVVTDQSTAVVPLVSGQSPTIALRAPPGIPPDAGIARFVNGSWQPIPTEPSGLQDLFISNPDALGDFAVLGSVAENPAGVSPAFLIAALVAAGLVALLGVSGARRIRASNPWQPPPAGPTARTPRRRRR